VRHMKYTVPEYRVASLKKRLETLNKKALVNCVDPVVFSFSPVRNDIHERWDDEAKKSVEYTVPVVDVEINLDTFKPIKGYTFLASIEHSPNGNIIVKNLPDVEVPEHFRTSGSSCDHCGTDRFRKNTYIVYNDETGEFLQVGSTCIKDFLGFNVSLIASRFEFLHILDGMTNGSDFTAKATPVINLPRFLMTAISFVNRLGYVSAKVANEDETKSPTGRDTWIALTSFKPTSFEQEILGSITNETLEKANTIIEWIKTQDINKDYFYNLNVVIKNGYVTSRTANLTASMVAVYYKAMEDKKENTKRITSEHIGEIDGRMVLEVEVLNVYPMETRFGRGYIYRMVTPEGNIVTWFTSTDKLEVGKNYRGLVRVKKHDQYKDIKQTVITRPSFKEIF